MWVVSVFQLSSINDSSYSKYPYYDKSCKQTDKQRNQQVKHAQGRFLFIEFVQVENPSQYAEGDDVVSLIL